MKTHIIALIALLGALASPQEVLAAGPAKPAKPPALPTIRLDLDDTLNVIATLENRGELSWCNIEADYFQLNVSREAPDHSLDIGHLRIGDISPKNDEGRFVLKLLGGSPVSCFKFDDKAPPLSISVSVKPLAYKGKSTASTTIQSPAAALSPGLDWVVYGGPWYNALLGALGSPKECTLKSPATAGATCKLGPIDENQGSLNLQVTGATDVAGVELTFTGAGTPKISIGVVPCSFEVTGPVPFLVPGTTSQRFNLSSKRPECERRLVGVRTLEREGFAPIKLQTRRDSVFNVSASDSAGTTVEANGVPETLPFGDATFTIKDGRGAIGTAVIRTIEKISTGDHPKVHVTYPTPRRGSGEATDYFAGASGTNEGIAVVSQGNDPDRFISNTVEISVRAPLPVRSDDLAGYDKCTTDLGAADSLPSNVVFSGATRLRWRLTPLAKNVELSDCIADVCKKDGSVATPPPERSCKPTNIDTVTFVARQINTAPIKVRLELMAIRSLSWKDNDTPKPQVSVVRHTKSPAILEEMLLETTLTLAESSRVESILLPIRDRMYVDCRGANVNVINGEMRAINDDDVINGACSLVLLPIPIGKPGPGRKFSFYEVEQSNTTPAELAACPSADCKKAQAARKETWLAGIRNWIEAQGPSFDHAKWMNPFFGPQRLLVSVKRDGTEIATRYWDVDPTQPSLLQLPRPADTKSGDLYTIEIRVGARPTETIVYRAGALESRRADDSDIAQADLRFSAQLRSRGMFGFKPACEYHGLSYGFRAYVTLPIQLAGIRLPAATSELRASSDATRFQYVTPRVGLMGVLEPWNYDTGRNPVLLNPSLAVGMLALELSKPRLALSTLVGIQVRAPIGDNSTGQLSNSLSAALALGVFWERGVEEKENRFLVTFGANVFSLFAGK